MYYGASSARPIQYHRQDLDADCGVACVQSHIRSFDLPLPQQYELYDNLVDCAKAPEKSTKDKWGANPACIATTLSYRFNLKRGQSEPVEDRPFNMLVSNSADEFSRWIAACIVSGSAAPTIVVWGDRHWVNVIGCDIPSSNRRGGGARDAQHSFDTDLKVNAFYVHDPAPRLWSDVDDDHNDPDECGTGIDANGKNWGLASRVVTYGFWRERWLTGLPKSDHCWGGTFVGVVRDDGNRLPDGIPACDIGRRNRAEPKVTAKGDYIGDDKARQVALQGLKTYGLMSATAPQPWGQVAAGVSPTEVHLIKPPSKKKAEDDFAYYLVLFETPESTSADRQIPVLALVDARTPTFLEAAAVKRRTDRAIQFGQVSQLIDLLAGFPVLIVPNRPPVQLSRRDIGSPQIVWRHAPESLTPYTPYYEIPVKVGGVQSYLWVRVDDRHVFDLFPPSNVPPPAKLTRFAEVYA